MRIAIIGGGVMGEAIASAIIRGGVSSPEEIKIGEINERRIIELEERYGVKCFPDNEEVIRNTDFLILSVKPQSLPEIFKDIGGKIDGGQVVMSIIAGASLRKLKGGLQHDKVIRVMPNTPAQIGEGVSVWTASDEVSYEERERAREILSTFGYEIYVPDEVYIDMATAVSGSGPAYIFYFVEAMIEGAVNIGLPRDKAREMVIKTILGSIKMLEETGKHPAELRDLVTSPAGTTSEALLKLEEENFKASLIKAIRSAYERAKELGVSE